MRLISYSQSSSEADRDWSPGLLVGDRVIDARRVCERRFGSANGIDSVRALLALDPADLAALGAAAEQVAEDESVALDQVRVGPPVPDPEKIICLGLNYRDHATESEMEVPEAPILFPKFRTSLAGFEDPIVLPGASQKVDYEGELAVVIGQRCKHVDRGAALAVAAGYMALNDISARDLQRQTGQWTAGKAVDTFAPCGPWVLTADEVADPHDLQITTRLNGEVMQEDSTKHMIFDIAETISFISSIITLEVGDIIATGTPAGVGATRTPPIFLQDGDMIEVEVSGLGVLRNGVVRENG